MGAFVFLVLAVFFLESDGRPDGAPLSACLSLTPRHSSIPPQSSVAPYSVMATKRGNKVEVTLASDRDEEFLGFAVQARLKNNRNRIVNGRFTTKNNVTKTIDCNGGRGNTLTMTNPSPKYDIVTEWVPDASLDEEVIFRATFAQTFATFWTEIDSNPVKIQSVKESQGRAGMRKDVNDTIYTQCSVSKGCFGIPSGCIARGDCVVLLSYAKTMEGDISVTMHGALESNEYMAMGLSTDKSMGDDSVTECSTKGSRIVASRSWNNGRTNRFLEELEAGAYNFGLVDGKSTCSFKLSGITETNGKIFNLIDNTYFILLAKGPLRNGGISYHTLREATQDPVNFNAFEVQEGEGISTSIKIHGCFMVTAWVGFVSIGILLARHFKANFENRTLCGVKIWFAFHRGLMLAALAFIVVAVIIIFVHKDGWNYETDNPHAALGVAATVLGLLQPIMALFRPGPDHPKRPIFNWLHFLVGNGGQLIAVLAIFYATKLDTSGLNDYFYAVMAVFVIVYLLFHLFFQVHTWSSERKKNNEVKMLDLASRGGNTAQNGVPEKNLVNQAIRQIFLGIYILIVAAILVALYALIGSA